MPSVFNANDNAALIARIEKIEAHSQRQWGKMNPEQMLAHCQEPIRVAFGELKLKRGLLGILFGKMAKKKLLQPGPFKRNLPTSKQFLIANPEAVEREREKLIALVKRFASDGEKGISKEAHPFFGPLTNEEWDVLHWKHLDHHLNQFGV